MMPLEAADVDPVAEHIRRLVDAAPPLSPEQRDRLAVLLRPTNARPAGAAAG